MPPEPTTNDRVTGHGPIRPLARRFVALLIGLVWFVNGLFCKVLGWVPRHHAIVAGVIGEDHAGLVTILIGLGEIALAIWIWCGRFPRATALVQIALVGTMNAIEFVRTPELLLWGRWNAAFALAFMALVAWHGWHGIKRGS
jgi:hypothetical protein